MAKCDHSIDKVYLGSKAESWDDEYGSYHSTTTYYLVCDSCKKEIKVGESYLLKKHFTELTGRQFDFEEAKKCFKKNPELLYEFKDVDKDIIKAVRNNPKLEKALERKYKLIQKHKKEYIKMLRKYRGYLSSMDEITLHF